MTSTKEDIMKNALFPKYCLLDTSLYVGHTEGSGADAYTFYIGPNFIVALKKDSERVKEYLSKNGMEALTDIEKHDDFVLFELGWEGSDIFEKIKDMESYQKRNGRK